MRVTKALAFIVALSAVNVACGEWSAPLPTAPSDPSKGATISGTARPAADLASAVSPSRLFAPVLAALDAVTFTKPVGASSGLTVTVVGTSITATLSGSGNFVLTGVPSGTIQLHFSGPGVDARITISGVQPEHIKISITLNGTSATVDSVIRVQMDEAAEVEGVISSISHGDRSMKVNGIEIKVREAPVWNGTSRVGIETLAVGQRVRVNGTWSHDYVVASNVVINPGSTPTPPPPPGGSGTYAADGAISSISYGDRSMKVNGIEVKIWDAPVYRGSQRVGITELSVGQRVGVKGNWVEGKYIVATEVFIL
jgi:hypothetical protein